MNKITINLDGRAVTADRGATLLEIARANGADIPTLCDDPRLPPYASCFVCIVEVQGRKGMAPACATKAEDGMVVRTNTEKLRGLRKLALELLLSNHHGDCVAPCNMTCPAGIDIRAYLSEAARGNFKDALRIIKERNPFPSVCGRICPHPCEDVCRRKLVDEAVSINQVKRYIADHDRCSADAFKPQLAPKNGKKIAVIGGGPGGLSAAYYLAMLGYGVTVFEAMPKAGGMLRYGVPDYRLPQVILDAEIEQILELGVELKTGIKWGRDFSLDSLREDGYSAIVTAVGAWTGQAMGAEGEDLPGVWSGIAMLEKVNTGQEISLGKKVVVVGGGNTAMDCARSSLRLGAEEVTLVYRRSRAEMPANPEEVEEAHDEGVKMMFLTAPVSFSKAGDRLAMKCVEMRLGAPDASGRRRPEPVPGSEKVVEADSVIAAIGQKVRWDGFNADGLKLTKWGTPEADPGTLRSTSHADVYVAGDCLNGPATAIEAIANGRFVALNLHNQLSGEKLDAAAHPFNIRKGELKDLTKEEHSHYPKMPRVKVPQLEAYSRARSCSEVSKTLERAEAMDEAKRCLLCGCQEVNDCMLRKHSSDYGATGELYPGQKTRGGRMPRHPYIERDHQKCILCGRCVRVCTELQGSGAIGLAFRGFVTEVASAWHSPLKDYACKSCGQCVSACPAAALSAKFKSVNVPSWRSDKRTAVCAYCGVGCVLEFSTADGKVQRLNNKFTANPANGFTCARAFSGLDLCEAPERLKEPMIKENGAWRAAKWDEALAFAARGFAGAKGSAVAVLASPRLSNEALFLLNKIARNAFGTNELGLAVEPASLSGAYGMKASPAAVKDLLAADLVIADAAKLERDWPSIAAAVRSAAARGVPVLSSPDVEKLKAAARPVAVADLRDQAGVEAMSVALKEAGKPDSLLALRFGTNAQGAIDNGFLRPAADILAAAEKGSVKHLLSWGDNGLDGRGLKGAFTVAAEWTAPAASHPAAVVFPAALFYEDAGCFTSLDGTISQGTGWKLPGAPQANWLTAAWLAKSLGLTGYEDICALRREMGAANPLYAGITCENWPKARTASLRPARTLGAGQLKGVCRPEAAAAAHAACAPAAAASSPDDMPARHIRARLAEVAAKTRA